MVVRGKGERDQFEHDVKGQLVNPREIADNDKGAKEDKVGEPLLALFDAVLGRERVHTKVQRDEEANQVAAEWKERGGGETGGQSKEARHKFQTE